MKNVGLLIIVLLFPMTISAQNQFGVNFELTVPNGSFKEMSYPGIGGNAFMLLPMGKHFLRFDLISYKNMNANDEGEISGWVYRNIPLPSGWTYYHNFHNDFYINTGTNMYLLEGRYRNADFLLNLGITHIDSKSPFIAEIKYCHSLEFNHSYMAISLGVRFNPLK